MDISISEFQALTNERVTQTMRTAELERRLAEKTDECEKLRGEVEHLKLENTAAQIENIWLKNYITLSVAAEVKPIAWLRTVETARLMLTRIHGNLLESKQLTVGRMNELASKCFTKQGEPLKLAKPKREFSADADEIENFLPTISDL